MSVLIALSGALGGCSGALSSFDPSDMLDWLDTKKKLPGERKPVFPEGVPGLEQGVPKDLYKGARQQPEAQNAAAAQPLEPPPGSKASKSKGKSSKQAAAPAQPAAPADADAAPAEEENSVAAAPPPPKPKIVRRRTTAPPPDPQQQAQPAQQQQSAFPAPVPSGSFSR